MKTEKQNSHYYATFTQYHNDECGQNNTGKTETANVHININPIDP